MHPSTTPSPSLLKVFASDFDGTLYFQSIDSPGHFSQGAEEAVRAYQASGYLFGLCTGRPIDGLLPFLGSIKPDFFISSTGAYITDGELFPIVNVPIPAAVADRLVKEYLPAGNRMLLQVEGGACVFEKRSFPMKLQVISSAYEVGERSINQVSIHGDSFEEASDIRRHVLDVYGDVLDAFQNRNDIDIVPRGCSKGKGIAVIREHFSRIHGKDTCVYGIGDSLNDLPLLEASDVSYTFPYAPLELQNKAAKVVDLLADALMDSQR